MTSFPTGHVRRLTTSSSNARKGAERGEKRAFRGLALVFVLSFLNLLGVLVTVTALGGLAPWSRWQFIGFYGAIEIASGLANVISPNIWRLPIAQSETSDRTDVRFAASALLLPHWGGLARSAAGLVCVAVAAWKEGIGTASVSLVPFVLGVALAILALSALLARAGVSRPDIDVVQFVVRWRKGERELAPISIGASFLQFTLGILTIPAVKLFPPSVMYQPEIATSAKTLLITLAVSVALVGLVHLVWSGRAELRAPAEQQREAEEHG